jgi:hypothetical protein
MLGRINSLGVYVFQNINKLIIYSIKYFKLIFHLLFFFHTNVNLFFIIKFYVSLTNMK